MTSNTYTHLQKRRFQELDADGNPIVIAATIEKTNEPTAAEKQLADEKAELLKEVMKRKGSEAILKTEVTALGEKLKAFDGIDPVVVRALLADKVKTEQTELEKRGEFDRVKAQMTDAHATELQTLRESLEAGATDISGKLAAATSQITELTIGRSFGDSPFVRDSLTLTPSKARVVYGSHFELQDGKVVAYDKPAGAATRTVYVDAAGEPLSFDLAIEKIVKADPDVEHLIRSKLKPGAGSKGTEKGDLPDVKVASGRDRIAAAMAGGALKPTTA